MNPEYDGEESEYEEVEEYLIINVPSSSVESKLYTKQLQLTGLETETPFVKVGNTIYRGKKIKQIGTEIIFKTNQQSGTADGEPPKLALNYLTHNTSKLLLTKVELMEKST